MMYCAIATSLLGLIVVNAAAASASSIQTPNRQRRDYVNQQQAQNHVYAVCEGINVTSLAQKPLNYDLPCNAITAIQYQCRYGADLGRAILNYYRNDNETGIIDALNSTGSLSHSPSQPGQGVSFSISELPEQSNETQRVCFCESQWFDQSNACNACSRTHGASAPNQPVGNGIPDVAMSSFSSDYCAITHTATAPFTVYSFSLAIAAAPVSSSAGIQGVTVPYSITADWTLSSGAPSSLSTYSDSLGNEADATDVSLYYTPSVTGSQAWNIADPTSMGAGASAGPMETLSSIISTSSGQIVPTVTPMTTVSHLASTTFDRPSSSPSPSTTKTAGFAAAPNSGAIDACVRPLNVFALIVFLAVAVII